MSRMVTFRMGDSRFALPADVVSEVVDVGPITQKVPDGREDVVGLVQVRGRWIPVVDLARVLPDVEERELDTRASMLVVLGRDRARLGLRVEDLGEVRSPTSGTGPARGGSEEILELDGELVRVIDPEALLGSQAELIRGSGDIMDETQATQEPVKFVAFRVGDEEFGVDVMRVQEVLHVPEIRKVPKAPEFVEGMVEARNAVIPVIDMRKRFGLPEREREAMPRLLVAEIGDGRVGLVVDSVPGVVPVSGEAISSPPEFFKGLAGRYLEGIARDGERLIILLNLDEVLTSKERIDLQKLLKAASSGKKRKKKGSSRSKGRGTGKSRKKKKGG